MGAKRKKNNRKGGNKKTNGMYGSEQDEDDEINQDEYFSNSDGYDSDGEPKAKKITMYVKYTKYSSVKEAGKHFADFHLSKRLSSDWDVAWSDTPVNI